MTRPSESASFATRHSLIVAAGLLLLVLNGCQQFAPHAQPPVFPRATTAVDYPAPEEWHQTELFFGLMRLDQSIITEREWRAFCDANILTRFPDGLTVIAAEGRYLDATKHMHKEPSRLVILLYPKAGKSDADKKIREITAEYIAQFDQESVLRMDSTQTVSFIARKSK